MRVLSSTLCAVLLLAAPVLAQNAPPIRGTIKSSRRQDAYYRVSRRRHLVVTAALVPNTTITPSAKRTLADIKPGDFIASGGTRGPDGVIRANEIRIFSGGAGGEGQFPMAQPGDVMTNATACRAETGATVNRWATIRARLSLSHLSRRGRAGVNRAAPGARPMCRAAPEKAVSVPRSSKSPQCSRGCAITGRRFDAQAGRQGEHECNQGRRRFFGSATRITISTMERLPPVTDDKKRGPANLVVLAIVVILIIGSIWLLLLHSGRVRRGSTVTRRITVIAIRFRLTNKNFGSGRLPLK